MISELLGSARPLTPGIHTQALKLARGSALSFYDALMVAAASGADAAYCSPKTCGMVGNSAPWRFRILFWRRRKGDTGFAATVTP